MSRRRREKERGKTKMRKTSCPHTHMAHSVSRLPNAKEMIQIVGLRALAVGLIGSFLPMGLGATVTVFPACLAAACVP